MDLTDRVDCSFKSQLLTRAKMAIRDRWRTLFQKPANSRYASRANPEPHIPLLRFRYSTYYYAGAVVQLGEVKGPTPGHYLGGLCFGANPERLCQLITGFLQGVDPTSGEGAATKLLAPSTPCHIFTSKDRPVLHQDSSSSEVSNMPLVGKGW